MGGRLPYEPTDGELVIRFRGGDVSAFEALVTRHERRIYNLAYRMLGRAEDARDATQDAFLSCYRNLAAFRGDSTFGTWLHRIAMNACYDMLRKHVPEPVADEDLHPAPTADHADAAVAAADVEWALARIPQEFRAVLVLHDLQGFHYEEIATIIDVPLGTVKSRLHRGRLALADVLAGGDAPAPGADSAAGGGGSAAGEGEQPGAPAASKPPTTQTGWTKA